jgi:hypothetical protein
MSDVNFVRMKMCGGLLAEGLRPAWVQVEKLNTGGYMVKALVVNVATPDIEDAQVIPFDYRVDAIESGGKLNDDFNG